MSEIEDDKNTGTDVNKTLFLKGSFESGLIRQNFAHGRSKSVIVEKKKRRVVAPSGQTEGVPVLAVEAVPVPAVSVSDVPVVSSPPIGRVKKVNSQRTSGSGVKARLSRDSKHPSLTDEERGARAQALVEACADDKLQQVRRAEEDEARRHQEQIDLLRAKEAEEASMPVSEDLLDTSINTVSPAVSSYVAADTCKVIDSNEKRRPSSSRKGHSGSKGLSKEMKQPVKPAASVGERRRSRLTVSNALSDEGERSRSMASIRRQRERARKQSSGFAPPLKQYREVVIPETISIYDLSNRMAERAADVIKLLMTQGQMVQINDVINADLAQLIAEEMGHTVHRVADSDVEAGLFNIIDEPADLLPRPPVVTVMGHVDHGKTSLLDALRKTDVVSSEVGGITQHIGAYQVDTGSGKVTFIDTPGHAAFTAMRERGAKVTDIVVLVVAADDGVMPQTIEAINHARAAEVPIIVAINKMDKSGTDVSSLRVALLQHGVMVESMGGDVIDVEVSALKGLHIDKLLEMILLQAEMLDLRANSKCTASGVVVESRLDKGRGSVATLLIQRGHLCIGDILVAGTEWGRVKALTDDRGESQIEVGVSRPIEVLGLNGAPDAGVSFVVVENDSRAREIADYRRRQQKDRKANITERSRGSLEEMMGMLKTDGCKYFPIVIKGDARGSIEAIVNSLEDLGTEEVKVRIVHSGVGGINEADVSLASASVTHIIGFNVRANQQVCDAANKKSVKIQYYSIIYDLIDDMKKIMSGMLAPERRETFLGNAEVLEIFNITKVGKVGGSRVTSGKVERGASVRLLRDDIVIHEGKLSTLKRFKDEVKDVIVGQECGIAFENYNDIRAGDIIECFRIEEIQRHI